MQHAQNGGFIVTGVSERRRRGGCNSGLGQESMPPMNLWITKIDSEGSIVWNRTLIESTHSYINSIQQLTCGGFIAAGYFEEDSERRRSSRRYRSLGYFWVIKLDSEGNIVWQKTFGGSSADIATSIKKTNNGYIAAGMTNSIDGDVPVIHSGPNYWIIKLNYDGEIEWKKLLNDLNGGVAYDIYPDENGYIVAGFSYSYSAKVSNNRGNGDYCIVKLNLNGDIVWQKTFGGSGGDAAYSIAKTLDDCYIITGYSSSSDGDIFYNHGKADYWIIKIDSDGGLIWEKTYGGSETDIARYSCYTNDGGMIIVGYSESKNGDVSESHGSSDYWVIKLKLND
jgi:hypothetical protein